MGKPNIRMTARLNRKRRIRKKISGTSEQPRLSVFRSSKHIYAQVINDQEGKTVAAASSLEKEMEISGPKKAVAGEVGKLIAQRSINLGIKKVVFDRGGFLYHGRVKAVSEGAREAGLIF